ncbi:MAG: hypothetical protein QFB87_01095 [Patescibacteria group bacterium]|nr:hypothetical protein [Patescibacteria group bacterium]
MKLKINIQQISKTKLLLVSGLIAVVTIGGGITAAKYYSNTPVNGTRVTVGAPAKQTTQPAVSKPATVAAPTQNKPATTPVAVTPKAATPATTTAPKPTAAATVTPVSKPAGPTLDQIVATINQHLQPYGVTATLSPANNSGTYSTWLVLDNNDVNQLNTFSTYLIDEFSKYPTDLVVNSGLKTIGLVKSLQVSGGSRAAAPAPSITGMLYDVIAMTNAGSAYAREVVSHEYWHYLDYKMRGSYSYADSQWNACNPSGFSYGSGGASAYGPNSGYTAAFHPQAGFITAYSKYAIEEDRAEMFGWLMYSSSSVKNLADSGINCKTSRLTTIVHQLSPAMTF